MRVDRRIPAVSYPSIDTSLGGSARAGFARPRTPT